MWLFALALALLVAPSVRSSARGVRGAVVGAVALSFGDGLPFGDFVVDWGEEDEVVVVAVLGALAAAVCRDDGDFEERRRFGGILHGDSSLRIRVGV